MKILILGAGCANCLRLEENVRRAVAEKGKTAEIGKVTDYSRIASYGVMRTPALIIDGTVKSDGRVPGVEEIKGML